MYECFPFDPDHFTCFVDATRIDIAIKKIAKLFEYKDTTDWAGLDSTKWPGLGYYPDGEVVSFDSCPEELKEAYQAIRDVREALLKLERSLT